MMTLGSLQSRPPPPARSFTRSFARVVAAFSRGALAASHSLCCDNLTPGRKLMTRLSLKDEDFLPVCAVAPGAPLDFNQPS